MSKINNKELKPCPFCGKHAILKTSEEFDELFHEHYVHGTVECTNMICMARVWSSGKDKETVKNSVRAKWNKRT